MSLIAFVSVLMLPLISVLTYMRNAIAPIHGFGVSHR